MSVDTVPPVEPASSTLIAPTAPAPRKRQKRITAEGSTVIKGADLQPDLDAYHSSTVGFWYWVGVIPECPVQAIDCAGINFPLFNADLVQDRHSPAKRHLPKIGAIVFLTEERIRLMAKKLPRIVIRFKEASGGERRQNMSLSDKDQVKRREGQLITIPTKEELAEARAQGRGTQPYVRSEHDEPAARYMFAVPCPDQERPQRSGDLYPDTLDITGLVWPGNLEL